LGSYFNVYLKAINSPGPTPPAGRMVASVR